MLTGPPSGASGVRAAPLRVNSGEDWGALPRARDCRRAAASRYPGLFCELNPLCSLKKIRRRTLASQTECARIGSLAYRLHYRSHRRFRLQVRP
jgi:hypothetical protein